MSILTLTDITTLFVAILSLIMSIIFSRLQQKHNRNSVIPIASIDFSDFEDFISVDILNVGTGPLIIKRLTITDSSNRTINSPNLISLMPDVPQSWSNYTTEFEDKVLPINGKTNLISLVPQNDKVKYSVRSALSSKIITIEYEDIYGTPFTKQRKRDFFGRFYKVGDTTFTRDSFSR